MTPGRLLYLFKAKYRHGLLTAYYRDTVRRRILETPPVENTVSPVCEIHALTSEGDWLNLIWTLKTFYRFSKRSYLLSIHEDGSLTPEARAELRKHFPKARLIPREEADRVVPPALAAYPRSAELRRTNVLSLKLFDFRQYLQSDRLLLVDSDILFFEEPVELLRRIETPGYLYNSVNADIGSAYTVDPEVVRERLGFTLPPLFNSGLGLIHRASLDLDWIEEFLALPGIVGHWWRIEQTLFALCSSKFGVELLPEVYRVRLEGDSAGLPCRHYIGKIRHLMYREGIRNLVRSGFLKQAGRAAAARA